ncbi:MAG: sulfite exporter TauE/SafE family protein [Rhodocyclaceae bacterium]|nr:sulfite exporter TauE/SafE family protein [Rhodocyclaceae bacterium]
MIDIWLLGYVVLGLVAGFFAGLLGVGGGAIMVPVLALMFAAQGFPDAHLMHLALGTSMATIVFTSISSLRAHHKHGAVLWPVVKAIAPGIVLGTLLGARIASHVPTRPLAIFFSVFMAYVAVQMILNVKPKPSRELPGAAGMAGVGGVIGFISALVAIGGGSLSVPFMTWCNVKMHNAIGTSAAIGLPIAAAGTVGYLWSGWIATGLPTGSVGFIYLPALLSALVASMLMAPVGAKVAHSLPVATIKKIFAGVIILLLAKMLHGLF